LKVRYEVVTYQFAALVVRGTVFSVEGTHYFVWGVCVSGWGEGGCVERFWERDDKDVETDHRENGEEAVEFGWHTGVLVVDLIE
jgi:hypothetical protein